MIWRTWSALPYIRLVSSSETCTSSPLFGIRQTPTIRWLQINTPGRPSTSLFQSQQSNLAIDAQDCSSTWRTLHDSRGKDWRDMADSLVCKCSTAWLRSCMLLSQFCRDKGTAWLETSTAERETRDYCIIHAMKWPSYCRGCGGR